MVYCGKPSRGCQMCRTRRIKCDEGRPTCLQCQKSRRQCPGYKDDFDLVFRNETQATERRAKRAGNPKRLNTHAAQRNRSDSENSGNGMFQISPISAASSSTTISQTLTVPISERAANFFLANFVLQRDGVSRGFLDFVIPMIKTEPPNSTLSYAFGAVALAGMGNRPNAKTLLPSAGEQYSRALQHVNAALRDPVLQKADSTLAAVMLLGLFELITSRRTNIMAWGSHIDGAVMLVKMRGKKQLRTKIGQSLFAAVRMQMIINCMTASKPVDQGVEWWLADAVQEDTSHRATRLHLLVIEMRADVNRLMTLMHRTPENIASVVDILRRAQELDKEFLHWRDTLPEEWQYKTMAWVDNVPGGDLSKAEVCPGKIDLYTCLSMAATWNSVRISRLFLIGIQARCSAWLCSPVDYRTRPEYAATMRTGVDIITDICASVPYSLGYKFGHTTPHSAYNMDSGFATGDDASVSGKSVGGYLSIWPLFCANNSDYTTDTQRKWVLGRLKYITEVLGIDQASTFAHYQLRLPSMIIKRDSFGLLSQVPRLPTPPRTALPISSYPVQPTYATQHAPYAPSNVNPPLSSAYHTASGVPQTNILPGPPTITPPASPDHSKMSPEAKQMLAMGQAMGLIDEFGRPNLANLAKLSPQERQMLEMAKKSGMLAGLGFGPGPSAAAPPQVTPPNVGATYGIPGHTTLQQQAEIQAAQQQDEAQRLAAQQHEQAQIYAMQQQQIIDQERERLATEAELLRLQRETFEREREILLRKAAGHGPGTEDMEKMVGKYFNVNETTR